MKFDECIEACEECAVACDQCAASCLDEPNIEVMRDCMRHDLDCTQLCRLAAGLMARNSMWAADICRICAEACTACAEECGKHQMDHCQACARACRRCANLCLQMAGSGTRSQRQPMPSESRAQ